MNKTKLTMKTGKAGCMLGAVLLITLTGCVAYVDRPRSNPIHSIAASSSSRETVAKLVAESLIA